MSMEQRIKDVCIEIGKINKKHASYFTNHYHINGVFSDLLPDYEDTIKSCGFSMDGFDNAVMSLGKLYYDLTQEVLKKKEMENVGYEVLKAFEVGKSSTAKRLIFHLLKAILNEHDLDATMFKWEHCIFCSEEVFPYHNRCNNCNTEFKVFYETDDLYNEIIVEVNDKIDTMDVKELRKMQRQIKQFLNHQLVRRIDSTSSASTHYKKMTDRIRLEYENIEDKFISAELEVYELKAIELEKFLIYGSKQKFIDSHVKKLDAINKYIVSLGLKQTSTVYERVGVLTKQVSHMLSMVDEYHKLGKLSKDFKLLEKKLKAEQKIARGKNGFQLSQQETVFALTNDFENIKQSINPTLLEELSYKEYQKNIDNLQTYLDELTQLEKIRIEKDIHKEVLLYTAKVSQIQKEVEGKLNAIDYDSSSHIETVRQAKLSWEKLHEKASSIFLGIRDKEGVDNLNTYDEILKQETIMKEMIQKIYDQTQIAKDLVDKIAYLNRKREIELRIKNVQQKYSKIEKNVFFVQEYSPKERRKRLAKRLKNYVKILDELSIMKKDMRLLSDGIELDTFDEQRDLSMELSDTFDMEYNRINEERDIVVEMYAEKKKKHRIQLIISFIVLLVISGGVVFGYNKIPSGTSISVGSYEIVLKE